MIEEIKFTNNSSNHEEQLNPIEIAELVKLIDQIHENLFIKCARHNIDCNRCWYRAKCDALDKIRKLLTL